MVKVRKSIRDSEGVRYDSEPELAFATQLKERGIKFTRQDKYVLPSRFFRTHSWKSDFEFTVNKKKYIIDVKGWFTTHDKMKLSFVEAIHNIRVDVVGYKVKQKNGIKTYNFDWSFLGE